MTMALRFGAAVILLAAVGSPVWAVATVTSAERSVLTDVNGFGGSSVNNNTSGVYHVGAHTESNTGGNKSADAQQNTDIQPLSMGGTGSAHISDSDEAEDDSLRAESFFDVFFDLAAPHAFSLTGTLTGLRDGGFARTELLFFGPDAFVHNMATGNIATTVNVNESGQVGPGSYHLMVKSFADDNFDTYSYATATFDFNLTLREAAVPEPTTVALLALAGTALVLRRRGRHVPLCQDSGRL